MVSWFEYFNLLYILLYDLCFIIQVEIKSIEDFSNLCFHENKLTSLYQTYFNLKRFSFSSKRQQYILRYCKIILFD